MARLHALLAAAAAVALTAPAAAETVAITNAHILTAGPQGEIASGTIVIADGKLIAIGAGAAAPAGARVIDAKGAYVTPGLFATGSELGGVEVGSEGDDLTVDNPVLIQDPGAAPRLPA